MMSYLCKSSFYTKSKESTPLNKVIGRTSVVYNRYGFPKVTKNLPECLSDVIHDVTHAMPCVMVFEEDVFWCLNAIYSIGLGRRSLRIAALVIPLSLVIRQISIIL